MNTSPAIRPPAVAGSFYPQLPAALRQQLLALLGEAPAPDLPGLKVVLVPHAGYVYSGSTAARLYASLISQRQRIRRVILLGPAHRVALEGMAVPQATHWASPLGISPVDRELALKLQSAGLAVLDDAPHAAEHALEVQLPFLQTVLLPGTPILPVAVGRTGPAQVAALLDACWGGSETLIVLSTDLSHYLPYAQARTMDQETVAHLLAFNAGLNGKQACGAFPLNGFLEVAARRGLHSRLIDLRNSGDTAGSKDRVVGYAAIAYQDAQAALGEVLLRIARGIIEARFGAPAPSVPDLPVLHETAACFVTLTKSGRLRGCIGSLQAHRRLVDDVIHNAQAAAFNDPRFPALSAGELDTLRVEVSLLTPPEPMHFADETEALAALRPGIDGVILEEGRHRSTYLPQVWEQLPTPAVFLSALKEKAGLPADYWSTTLRLQRYAALKWKEAM